LYQNNGGNDPIYGKLYNFFAIETGKLCPTGWHVPTEAERSTLADYLGGFDEAGGKMKEVGNAYWNERNLLD
jgi:uncharacterized protein (TIGR02145 family)